jgi:hypothetical protein
MDFIKWKQCPLKDELDQFRMKLIEEAKEEYFLNLMQVPSLLFSDNFQDQHYLNSAISPRS